ARLKVVELPIPTYYGDEICYVNGVHYAFNVVAAALKAHFQEMGLFYDRKFDCAPRDSSPYTPKLTYASPHDSAIDYFRPGSKVLDLGIACVYMGAILSKEKHCAVTGVDTYPATEPGMEAFHFHDLNQGPPALDFTRYDFVLMLDVIEHL